MRQAVILVGGRGTRLGALTRDVPKPLLPIAGRSPFRSTCSAPEAHAANRRRCSIRRCSIRPGTPPRRPSLRGEVMIKGIIFDLDIAITQSWGFGFQI